MFNAGEHFVAREAKRINICRLTQYVSTSAHTPHYGPMMAYNLGPKIIVLPLLYFRTAKIRTFCCSSMPDMLVKVADSGVFERHSKPTELYTNPSREETPVLQFRRC